MSAAPRLTPAPAVQQAPPTRAAPRLVSAPYHVRRQATFPKVLFETPVVMGLAGTQGGPGGHRSIFEHGKFGCQCDTGAKRKAAAVLLDRMPRETQLSGLSFGLSTIWL